VAFDQLFDEEHERQALGLAEQRQLAAVRRDEAKVVAVLNLVGPDQRGLAEELSDLFGADVKARPQRQRAMEELEGVSREDQDALVEPRRRGDVDGR
jgi:hypothetical protein